MRANTLHNLPTTTKDTVNHIFLDFCIATLGAGDPSAYITKVINTNIGAKKKFAQTLSKLTKEQLINSVDVFIETFEKQPQ